VPRDLYDVLGVPGTASEAEIRRAFWALAKKYHPDVNVGSPAAARRFVEAGSAAETLLDPRRRACYDKSRTPGTLAHPPDAAPKPPPPPSTPQSAGKSRPATPEPVSQPGDPRWSAVKAVAAVALLAAVVYWMNWGMGSSARQKDYAMPANGTVVWNAAGFSLGDGWGINLAGDGARIQILPGMSADIEFADGYLVSAGQIGLLPRGQALTYQHCLSAVEQAASQSDPLGEIAPATGSSLCVSGSGGDLASIRVTHDDGSSLTVNIRVWESV
jgi:DnaJ domain